MRTYMFVIGELDDCGRFALIRKPGDPAAPWCGPGGGV
jgi:hypothetical protein